MFPIQAWNKLAFGQITADGNNDYVDEMERSFIQQLVDIYGWDWSFRIEMFLVIVITMIFTMMICILLFAWLFKRRFHDTTLRFSDKLDGFTYVLIETDKKNELVIRKPGKKNFFEGLELTLALWYSFLFRKKPIQESTLRMVTIFFIIFILVMIVLMYFVLVFSFNTFEG